jgi:hypothetical protein
VIGVAQVLTLRPTGSAKRDKRLIDLTAYFYLHCFNDTKWKDDWDDQLETKLKVSV